VSLAAFLGGCLGGEPSVSLLDGLHILIFSPSAIANDQREKCKHP
jgi:hypothetical protein